MSTSESRDPAVPVNFVTGLNEALTEAMAADPSILVFGEDVVDNPHGGVFGVTNGLSTRFGESRVRSTPIAEQAILGAAIGAALGGMRPVAEIMLFNFMTIAMDMLTNHAAKLRFMSGGQTPVPITIRTAAGAGKGFGAQHSEMLEAWLAHIPGLKVVVPSNPADAKGLLTACIEDDDPCVIIEQHHLYFSQKGLVPVGRHSVPIGKAVITRPGTDVTVVTYGRQVHDALAVGETVSADGIDVEVIDLRSISPVDTATVLESVSRTRRVVIAHEAVQRGGVGAEIAAVIGEELFGELDAPVRRVGAPFAPIPFARNLEDLYLPGVVDIEAAVRAVTSKDGVKR